MRPGVTMSPAASMILALPGSSFGATAATRPLRVPMSRPPSIPFFGSMTRPPLTTASNTGVSFATVFAMEILPILLSAPAVMVAYIPLSNRDRAKQRGADHAQDEERCKDRRRFHPRTSVEDVEAEPGPGRDELADDDADDRQRHRDFHPAEDRRQREREPHQHKTLPIRGGQRAAEAQGRRIGAGKPKHRRDDDGKEADEDGKRDARLAGDAEPDNKKRRQRNFRNELEQHQVRVQHVAHQR